MTILRRFLALFALMFWLGGFMFYGAVVVPISRVRFAEPSILTRDVTQWMNLIGTLAVLFLFADVYASPVRPKRWRWLAWLGMALPLPLLVWLHRHMSDQMRVPGFHQSDLGEFLTWHRVYLLLNTFQWAAGMVYTVLSLRAWREEDRSPKASDAP